MSNICDTCPRMQPYYPVGSCPECGTPGLMMDTKTFGAVCSACGQDYGIPMVVPGICDNAVMWERYTVTIKPPLTLEQLRRLARIVDESSVALYKEAKAGTLCFEELSYGQVFWLRTMLLPMGVELEITPELQEYEKYLECHGHSWEVRAPYERRIPTKVVWLADKILRLRHSDEEWLALEKELHEHWDALSRASREYLEDSGACEAVTMACSGIRWARGSLKVKYIGDGYPIAFDKGKVYDVISIEEGWYRVMTELDEDYLFPPELFETVIENS